MKKETSVKNVKTPNKPMQGTRLRNFIASGGKAQDYKSCKGSNAGCGTKK